MHFIFLTRTHNPICIQTIKNDIKVVFDNQPNDTHHTYEHVLMVDCTHFGVTDDKFSIFEDEHTHVHFVRKKADYYLSADIDDYMETVTNEDAYVYIIDDDNTIHPDFLQVCDECNGADMLIFKIARLPYYGNPGCRLGSVDSANYITKVSIFRKCKMSHIEWSRAHDGIFVERVRAAKFNIQYSPKNLGYYNHLRQLYLSGNPCLDQKSQS